MTKIAILCNYKLHPERVGGMDYFFWEFDKKCRQNNVKVDWFFPNKIENLNYDEMSIVSFENYQLETFFIDYIDRNNSKYDVIITHFVELCSSFFKDVKKQYPSKIICVDHNPRPLEGFTFKKKLIKKLKGILYSKYTDTFIGVSDYTTKNILKDYGFFLRKKTKTIYNGVKEELFWKRQNNESTFKKFILTSNLRYVKGLQDLIEAVSLLPETIIANSVFHLYGEGDYEAKLKELVKKHNLEKTIIFFGSSSILNEIYCQYDYMIQPTYMECFSLSILESLSANVPVITTTVGGNAEVVIHNDNGYLIEPHQPEQLAKLLKEICQGQKKINNEIFLNISENFNLKLMVDNHFKEL